MIITKLTIDEKIEPPLTCVVSSRLVFAKGQARLSRNSLFTYLIRFQMIDFLIIIRVVTHTSCVCLERGIYGVLWGGGRV